jgi:thiol-disulfide isomerase/thioredoxin
MKTNKSFTLFVLFFIGAVLIPMMCLAQTQSKHTISRKEYHRLIKLRATVETNMSSVNAHEALINAWGLDSALFLQYRIWMKHYPRLAAIPFVIGRELEGQERPEAAYFLLKAVHLNPKLAEAWDLLSLDAQLRGDINLARTYSDKAVQLDSLNVDYAFYNAMLYENIDTAIYHSLIKNISKRFPKSERSVQALYWLAYREKDINRKFAYYEWMRGQFAKSKSRWYFDAMDEYYKLIFISDPQKALDIASEEKMGGRIRLSETIIKAEKLLDEQRPAEAEALVKPVKLTSIDAEAQLVFFKARVADSAKDTRAAYDTVMRYYCKRPGDSLQKAMYRYALKLGLNLKLIQADVKRLRDSAAVQATGFSLYNYADRTATSLSDFKGKVILLTYWFPGCGPCRAEMPYFEEVLKKFDRRDVVYLGLNGITGQDKLVLPFLRSTGYSFIPLRDSTSGKGGTLAAKGYPTNFIIDQDGRIIFSDFRIDTSNEDMLELMIGDLLDADKKSDSIADTIKLNKN